MIITSPASSPLNDNQDKLSSSKPKGRGRGSSKKLICQNCNKECTSESAVFCLCKQVCRCSQCNEKASSFKCSEMCDINIPKVNMSKKMETIMDLIYAMLKTMAADIAYLKEQIVKMQQAQDLLLVQKPSHVANDGILIAYSDEKARLLIRYIIIRRALGDGITALFANIGTIFNLKFSTKEEVENIREKLGLFASDVKHKFKTAVCDLRNKMDTEERPYLIPDDEQYKKIITYLEDNKLLSLIKGLELAPVSLEEITKVWEMCGTDLEPPNIGMEILTSILCAMEKTQFENIFKDAKRTFFKNMDIILTMQPVPEIFINKFVISDTPFIKNLTGSNKRSGEELEKSEKDYKKQKKEEYDDMNN